MIRKDKDTGIEYFIINLKTKEAVEKNWRERKLGEEVAIYKGLYRDYYTDVFKNKKNRKLYRMDYTMTRQEEYKNIKEEYAKKNNCDAKDLMLEFRFVPLGTFDRLVKEYNVE